MYTINDARREVKELFDEEYGFTAVWVFLNDLVRGGDITREDSKQILKEIAEEKFGDIDISLKTIG